MEGPGRIRARHESCTAVAFCDVTGLPPFPSSRASRRRSIIRRGRSLRGRLTAGSPPDIVARLIGQSLSNSSASDSSPRTSPAPAPIFRSRPSSTPRPTATPCSWSRRRTRSARLLHGDLGFDLIRDIAPVAISLDTVRRDGAPSFPAKTIAELIACQGQSGQGQHRLDRHREAHPCRRRTVQDDGRRDLFHVPYRGEPEAQADLLAGRAQVMFDPIISPRPYQGRRLRALAVTTPKRIEDAARGSDRGRDRAGLV